MIVGWWKYTDFFRRCAMVWGKTSGNRNPLWLFCIRAGVNGKNKYSEPPLERISRDQEPSCVRGGNLLEAFWLCHRNFINLIQNEKCKIIFINNKALCCLSPEEKCFCKPFWRNFFFLLLDWCIDSFCLLTSFSLFVTCQDNSFLVACYATLHPALSVQPLLSFFLWGNRARLG